MTFFFSPPWSPQSSATHVAMLRSPGASVGSLGSDSETSRLRGASSPALDAVLSGSSTSRAELLISCKEEKPVQLERKREGVRQRQRGTGRRRREEGKGKIKMERKKGKQEKKKRRVQSEEEMERKRREKIERERERGRGSEIERGE